MDIIVLAAGLSKRFQEEGYNIPKPFLQIEYRGTTLTMLEHTLNTLLPPFYGTDGVFIGIPKGCKKYVPDYSEKRRHYDVLRVSKFVEIENSKGPAHTALELLKILNPKGGYIIVDVDVLNTTNDLIELCESAQCSVLVSKSANPSFSYVDNLGLFKKISEKKRISEYAVRGAYFIYYQQKSEFIDCLEKAVEEIKEPYISHALNLLHCEKRSKLTSYEPVDWGTPRDIKISGAHIVGEK